MAATARGSRRRAARLGLGLAGSLALHALWIGGTVAVVPMLPAVEPAATRTSVAVPVPVPPEPPPEPESVFGGDGGGRAALDAPDDGEFEAERDFQDQPLLAVAGGPAVPKPSAARALRAATVDLPPMPDGTLPTRMAMLLTPPPEPAEAASAEEETDAPPSPRADDRESDPTQRDAPLAVAEVSAGQVVSRDGIDFKPVGLRTGLSGHLDRFFVPAGTRVELEVVVDDAGVPLAVAVLRGSGSAAVDDAIEAAFFRWWFDAPAGEPFRFTLVLR